MYLPVYNEALIPGDDSVRLISQIVEGMDLKELYEAYSPKGRKPADPKTLFKILVYANMEGIYSSRKIASSCRRDINYMWLLAGEGAPNHSTISRFRTNRVGQVVEKMFYQLVKILEELGEIKYEDVFQDGTKLEANANKYTFVWRKTIEKNEMKMYKKAAEIAEEINKAYSTAFGMTEGGEEGEADYNMFQMETFLKQKMEEQNIEIVVGKGKRKSKEQKWLETIQTYRKREEGYETSKEILGERNSYSKTDTDATFMRMKDDHMKNGQLKAGYNVQLVVEGEYTIGAGVYSDCTDVGTLRPMLDNMYSYNPEMEIKNYTADAGYESEENYVYLEGKNIEYYIKPTTYEQSKTEKFKNDISKRENMAYNPETDEYTCHNQKQLKPKRTTKRKTATGYEAEITVYECEDCSGCPVKALCTKAKGNRQVQVSKTFLEKREESLKNLTTEHGALLRTNRSIQVEGAFGIIKEDRGFTRFLTRGIENVKTEILLLCFAYNVNKLHAKIQSGRCGKNLHIPEPKDDAA